MLAFAFPLFLLVGCGPGVPDSNIRISVSSFEDNQFIDMAIGANIYVVSPLARIRAQYLDENGNAMDNVSFKWKLAFNNQPRYASLSVGYDIMGRNEDAMIINYGNPTKYAYRYRLDVIERIRNTSTYVYIIIPCKAAQGHPNFTNPQRSERFNYEMPLLVDLRFGKSSSLTRKAVF